MGVGIELAQQAEARVVHPLDVSHQLEQELRSGNPEAMSPATEFVQQGLRRVFEKPAVGGFRTDLFLEAGMSGGELAFEPVHMPRGKRWFFQPVSVAAEQLVQTGLEFVEVLAASGAHHELGGGHQRGDFLLNDGGGFVRATRDENGPRSDDVVERGGGDGERLAGAGRAVADGERMDDRGAEELLLGRIEQGGRGVPDGRLRGGWIRNGVLT